MSSSQISLICLERKSIKNILSVLKKENRWILLFMIVNFRICAAAGYSIEQN